jgi:hypothetical protein
MIALKQIKHIKLLLKNYRMTKIAIMQPHFFPWGGYFQLINSCDYFIILDDVEIDYQSWQTRNFFYFDNKCTMISLPIKKTNNQLISCTELFRYDVWKKKFLNTLDQNYKKKENFSELKEIISIISKNHTSLLSINLEIIKFFTKILSIKSNIILSSELAIEKKYKKTEKIQNILCKFENPAYIMVPGSIAYMDDQNFNYLTYNTSTILYKKIFVNKSTNFNIFDLIIYKGFDAIIKNL